MATTNHGRTTWDQFTRRMEGVADRECANRGFAIVTIDVLVGSDGQPVFFTEPKIRRLEPRVGATLFLEKIMSMLGSENERG